MTSREVLDEILKIDEQIFELRKQSNNLWNKHRELAWGEKSENIRD